MSDDDDYKIISDIISEIKKDIIKEKKSKKERKKRKPIKPPNTNIINYI